MSRIFILLFFVSFSVYRTEQAYYLTDEHIGQINQEATTWKAGKNFPSDTPAEYFKSILGTINNGTYTDRVFNNRIYNTLEDVESFDARITWNHCQSIGHVRDQGHCDSSWAFSTTSVLSDRLCIDSEGRFNQTISAEHLTFCCDYCGEGCKGGKPIEAWEYSRHVSLPTGGGYGSNEGCQPYRVPPCAFDDRENNSCSAKPVEDNHNCPLKSCYGETNNKYFNTHVEYGYYLTPDQIEEELLDYGPVEATFDVYTDFLSYKSGVYSKTKSPSYLGRHSVKLIGWGVEEGVSYWLVINSWGSNWGDGGTFKIRKDTNECRIEDSVTAGVPEVHYFEIIEK